MNAVNKITFRKKIGTKLFIIILLSCTMSVLAAGGTLWYGNSKILRQILNENTKTSMTAVLDKAETMKASSIQLAKAIAEDESIVHSIESENADEIIQAANRVMLELKGDTEFITIADRNGNALARTHSSKTGDSVINQKNITEALQGATASYVEQGTEVKLSVRSSAPVKDAQGQIIGVISTGYKLDNPIFVDELKRLTGADVTVFLMDERINTTIQKDGVRQVGTKLNSDIANIVLEQMQSYHSETDILGKHYYAAYEPIVADDTVMGIFFVGTPMDNIISLEANYALTAVAFVLIICAIALLISNIITKKMIINPVKRISEAASMLENGNLNISDLTHKYDDEIGHMTTSISNMAATLKRLIIEMDDTSKKHSAGHISARIEEGTFSGAYRDVAKGVNEMTGSYVQYILDICEALKEFGNGNFNAPFATLPGEMVMTNDVIEHLRKCLKDVSSGIDSLAEAALAGKLNVRANTDNLSGGWKTLTMNLNNVMDTIIAPIEEASTVLCAMSEGNLNLKVTGTYKGDFDIIKTSLNSTQEKISSYIREISQTLSGVSNRDLTLEIKREYIGDFSIIRDSINMIISMFKGILSDVSMSAQQVAIGSNQISESNNDLAQGAIEQAGTMQELNASIEQVSMQAEKNAGFANNAEELVTDARTNTEKQAETMTMMLKAMDSINESSANISKIIKVIEDIAFQTNLLALNASIEAARAGEHGKGFSVVAEEVRNLATRSQEAVKDSSDLIEGTIQKVSEGVSAANKASGGLTKVVTQISETSKYINTIAQASKEQSASISQINDAIAQISRLAQTNTSISQECAATAEELSSQSEMFRNTIAKFKIK